MFQLQSYSPRVLCISIIFKQSITTMANLKICMTSDYSQIYLSKFVCFQHSTFICIGSISTIIYNFQVVVASHAMDLTPMFCFPVMRCGLILWFFKVVLDSHAMWFNAIVLQVYCIFSDPALTSLRNPSITMMANLKIFMTSNQSQIFLSQFSLFLTFQIYLHRLINFNNFLQLLSKVYLTLKLCLPVMRWIQLQCYACQKNCIGNQYT